MKKLLVLTVFIAGLFSACQRDFDDLHYTITNNTEEPITVLFNGESIQVPSSGGMVSRTVNSGQGIQTPRITAPVVHPRSIRMETRGSSTVGFDYTFRTIDPIPLYITNNLPIEAIVRAGNFLAASADDTTYLGQIEILPWATSAQIYIFTRTPTFTIHRRNPYAPPAFVPFNTIPGSGHSVIVAWFIVDNEMRVYLNIGN